MTNSASPSADSPRLLRVLVRFGLLTLIVLAGLWAWLGRMPVEKIATGLAAPCGIIWYLLMCCIVLASACRQRRLTFSITLTWLAYTICGSGFFACLLARNIERPFIDIDPLREERFDAVVLLGGGGMVGANGRIQGNTSGDRMILAAQMYHAKLTPTLICTGKRIEAVDGDGPDPSDVAVELLTQLGVPESAIERLGGHNTSQEMQNLRERFGEENPRVGLVTSAWHLQRALRLARKNGLELSPLPADFIGGPLRSQTAPQLIMSAIPQADNFFHVSRIAKEHLAGFVGR